jgi:hypothetical protein
MTDLDAEVLPDEGEEGGGEVNPPLPVQGHVHPDKLLVGQPDEKYTRKRFVMFKGANALYWSETVVIDFVLFFDWPQILESTYFRFRSLQRN